MDFQAVKEAVDVSSRQREETAQARMHSTANEVSQHKKKLAISNEWMDVLYTKQYMKQSAELDHVTA